jgi:aminoglycoside 2''-phosphotransferase
MDSDLAAYLDAIRACQPGFAIQSVYPIQDGWDFFVLEVNGEWIFRFPRRPEVTPSLEKEIALLPHLRRRLPVSVPCFEIVAPGAGGAPSAGGAIAWVGYPKIPGVSLESALQANPAAGPRLAQHIGEILTTLHTAALPWTVHRHLPLRTLLDWKRYYLDLYHELRERVFPLLDPSSQRKATILWEGYLRPRDHFSFEIALLHGDLGPEHILCDPQTARVTGILDWEDACTGDPALDFVGLLQAGGEVFVSQVLSSYSHDPGKNFWARLHFYTTIVPFFEIQFGLEAGDPQRTQSGVNQLIRILDD